MEAAMADLDRNAIPANADCRGGVFATRIFPPVLFTIREYSPAHRPRRANPSPWRYPCRLRRRGALNRDAVF